MPQTSRDQEFTQAFGRRLREVLDGQPQGVTHIALAIGYRDDTTLRSAMAGRTGLALSRLAALAAWARSHGEPIDLQWLLTGDHSTAGPERPALTSAQMAAIRVLAQALPSPGGSQSSPAASRGLRRRAR